MNTCPNYSFTMIHLENQLISSYCLISADKVYHALCESGYCYHIPIRNLFHMAGVCIRERREVKYYFVLYFILFAREKKL